MGLNREIANKYVYPSLAELNEAFNLLPELEMSLKGLQILYESIDSMQIPEEEKRTHLASVRQEFVKNKSRLDMLKCRDTKYDIERLRQIPISRFVNLPCNGKILCPFHKEKTPSLSINDNLFHCFGCGESGDTITFIQKTKGLNFHQALQFLSTQGGG